MPRDAATTKLKEVEGRRVLLAIALLLVLEGLCLIKMMMNHYN